MDFFDELLGPLRVEACRKYRVGNRFPPGPCKKTMPDNATPVDEGDAPAPPPRKQSRKSAEKATSPVPPPQERDRGPAAKTARRTPRRPSRAQNKTTRASGLQADDFFGPGDDKPVPPAQMRAIERMYNGTFAGLATRVTKAASARNGDTKIEGEILDADGKKVGQFKREIRKDPDGTPYIYHSLLSIDDPNLKGQGFANEFNRNAIEQYREAGFDRVELHANVDIGGYAWARAGYDWKNEGSTSQIRSRLKSRNTPASLAMVERFNNTRFGDPGYPTPLEVANVDRPPNAGRDDLWTGKTSLLYTGWDAVLPLQGGARQAQPVAAATMADDGGDRAERMLQLAQWHSDWVGQEIDATPFEPDGPNKAKDYNVQYVDVEASGDAQDEFFDEAFAILGQQQPDLEPDQDDGQEDETEQETAEAQRPRRERGATPGRDGDDLVSRIARGQRQMTVGDI